MMRDQNPARGARDELSRKVSRILRVFRACRTDGQRAEAARSLEALGPPGVRKALRLLWAYDWFALTAGLYGMAVGCASIAWLVSALLDQEPTICAFWAATGAIYLGC